jgi:hypothetical protein
MHSFNHHVVRSLAGVTILVCCDAGQGHTDVKTSCIMPQSFQRIRQERPTKRLSSVPQINKISFGACAVVLPLGRGRGGRRVRCTRALSSARCYQRHGVSTAVYLQHAVNTRVARPNAFAFRRVSFGILALRLNWSLPLQSVSQHDRGERVLVRL